MARILIYSICSAMPKYIYLQRNGTHVLRAHVLHVEYTIIAAVRIMRIYLWTLASYNVRPQQPPPHRTNGIAECVSIISL